MKLKDAQRISRKLEQAEREFDDSWATRWRAILFTGGALSLPLCLLAAQAAAPTMPDGGGLVVFFSSWGVSIAGLAGLGHVLRRRIKQREGMETTDALVLKQCAELGELPESVSAPLERALASYQHLSRMSSDPIWAGSGVQIEESVSASGRHLLSLMDWGKRLADVERTVARLEGRPGADEARARYQEQVAGLEAAAAAFQAAEAKAAQAYVALSGAAPGQTSAPAELAAMGATFEALAEVVGGSGVTPRASEEEPATLRVGRVS